MPYNETQHTQTCLKTSCITSVQLPPVLGIDRLLVHWPSQSKKHLVWPNDLSVDHFQLIRATTFTFLSVTLGINYHNPQKWKRTAFEFMCATTCRVVEGLLFPTTKPTPGSINMLLCVNGTKQLIIVIAL